MQKFLGELGAGFAFMGRQYHLEVESEDFYMDMLFCNVKLRCFVIVELKSDKFKSEYEGKMFFYLGDVNDFFLLFYFSKKKDYQNQIRKYVYEEN